MKTLRTSASDATKVGRAVFSAVGVWCLASLAQAAPAAATAAATAAAPRIEVFANSAMAIAPYPGATIYWLDGLTLITAEMSQGLPANEEQATALARQRFKNGGNALRDRSMNAVQGLHRANGYRIDRVPAIVINGESVVYGTTDIAAAVRLYVARKAGNP